MFNLSISSVLNSIDNVAKETLEEPKRASATQIREQRKREKENDSSISLNEDDAENRNEDLESNDIDQSDVSLIYHFYLKICFMTIFNI